MKFYNNDKTGVGTPITIPAGTEVTSISNEHRYVSMLLNNDNVQNYKFLGDNFPIKESTTKVSYLISAGPYCLIGINETKPVAHFQCPHSEEKVQKVRTHFWD